MELKVGHYVYGVRVSRERMFDRDGAELWAHCDPGAREIVLSPSLPEDLRPEKVRHEYWHAWCFHVPPPTDEEAQAVLHSTVSEAFDAQLHEQGGRDALLGMTADDSISVELDAATESPRSRPMPAAQINSDRMTCGGCGADVMCGSIQTEALKEFKESNVTARERWFKCDICKVVQVWWEHCASDGYPTGKFLHWPKPRMMHGEAAQEFITQKRGVSSELVVEPCA